MIPQSLDQLRHCETLIRAINDWIGIVHSITQIKMVNRLDNPMMKNPDSFNEFRKTASGIIYKTKPSSLGVYKFVLILTGSRLSYMIEI